uniref:Uncharacterized protein n=1 Tax=Anguilla anguilla TaxID=7936 RepID=A0A0E9SGU1_ANGAN
MHHKRKDKVTQRSAGKLMDIILFKFTVYLFSRSN